MNQWLKVVGLSSKTIAGFEDSIKTFEEQLILPETTLTHILKKINAEEDEVRKLLSAIKSLKLYTSHLQNGCPVSSVDIHWDSWDRLMETKDAMSSSLSSPRFNRSVFSNRRNRITSENEESSTISSTAKSSPLSPPQSASSQSTHWSPFDEDGLQGQSPPLTPPAKKSGVTSSKYPITPPPAKKHQLLSEPYPLTKSRSHDEHLSNRIESNMDGSSTRELSAVTSNSFNSLPPPLLPFQSKKHSQEKTVSQSQHTSPSPSSVGHYRRRLATEPGNLTNLSHTASPVMSPSSRSPPLVSPDQSDECFEELASKTLIPSNCPAMSSTASSSSSNTQSVAPRSPRTQAGGMGHVIHHRFCTTVKVTSVMCQLCEKPMYIGLKCKECKYKCHRDCEDKVPPSCGLPQELVNVFKQTIQQQSYIPSSTASSPANNTSMSDIMSPCSVKSEYRGRERRGDHTSHQHRHHHHHRTKFNGGDLRPAINITPFGDSSSNTSSCTSSAPSSPALLGSSNIGTPSSASKTQAFHFPDVSTTLSSAAAAAVAAGIASRGSMTPSILSSQVLSRAMSPHTSSYQYHLPDNRDVLETRRSNDSEKTMSITSGSTDSERTLAGRLDSQDSQMSCDVGDDGRSWPRQNSLTAKEWEIPFEELKLDSVIGTGRLGTVFRGQWHGLVAIKRLNLSSCKVDTTSGKITLTNPEDRKYFEAFKQDVATFRKTRHDNLVLFMGACMKPPDLAIVTSLCKGATLYTHLHVDKAKFDSRTTPLLIIQQICQGMSYLHARGIIHKDLKTKNIFYDRSNGKVVITDFGLFSVTKLCSSYSDSCYLTIPRGWLCYLSPEIIVSLKPKDNDSLPFSTASDVFAFGLVSLPLLTSYRLLMFSSLETPFK